MVVGLFLLLFVFLLNPTLGILLFFMVFLGLGSFAIVR